MKKIISCSLLLAVSLWLSGCAKSGATIESDADDSSTAAGPSPSATDETADVSSEDNDNDDNDSTPDDNSDFIKDAVQGVLAEITFSQLALIKSQDPDIKSFAATVIADHSKAENELKSLSLKQSVTPPADIDPDDQSTLEELQRLSGSDFDDSYVSAMIDDHNNAIELYKTEATDGTNPDLKAFAANTLPTLEKDMRAVTDIRDKMPE